MSDEQIKDNQMKILRPFGPSVAVVKIPQKIIEKLNEYSDKIINDEKKSNELDWGKNLAGEVKQEFKLEKDFMEKSGWLNFLATAVQNWIRVNENKKITKFHVMNSWVVRQFQNEYNPTHWHNGHISGVGYLKVPKSLGKSVQQVKDADRSNSHGCLELIHGSRMFLSKSKITITPEVGDFYIFPNYLMHLVYPFKDSNEERRSISFNAVIDESIYDAYSE